MKKITSKAAATLKPGDVVAVRVDGVDVLVLNSHQIPTLGTLLRFFKGSYPAESVLDLIQTVNDSVEDFPIFLSSKKLQTDAFSILGNVEIPDRYRDLPTFLLDASGSGKASVWRGNSPGESEKILATPEVLSLPMMVSSGEEDLVDMIRWRLRNPAVSYNDLIDMISTHLRAQPPPPAVASDFTRRHYLYFRKRANANHAINAISQDVGPDIVSKIHPPLAGSWSVHVDETIGLSERFATLLEEIAMRYDGEYDGADTAIPN